MNLFKLATQSKWYVDFLQPVVNEVLKTNNVTHVLDIGTGYGNLPKMLVTKFPKLRVTATDNDIVKINMAIQSTKSVNITYKFNQDGLMTYDSESYEVVTFCSILFLLDEATRQAMLSDAQRVLKPGGKIIVLTPTGKGTILSAFSEIKAYGNNMKELTYLVWRLVTRFGGKRWEKSEWLKHQGLQKGMSYSSTKVFNEYAVLETLTKNI